MIFLCEIDNLQIIHLEPNFIGRFLKIKHKNKKVLKKLELH